MDQDKKLHLLAGFAAGIFPAILAGPVAGVVVAAVAGLGKEAYDAQGNGTSEAEDLAATAAGGALASLWAWAAPLLFLL
jgi:hypothetical protein